MDAVLFEFMKPCPLCHRSGPYCLHVVEDDSQQFTSTYYVQCPCGIRGPISRSREGAIERWDFRPTVFCGKVFATPLEKELEKLLNKHGAENGSNTPDFILAKYLMGCLEAFNAAVKIREEWYGRAPVAVPPPATNVEGEMP